MKKLIQIWGAIFAFILCMTALPAAAHTAREINVCTHTSLTKNKLTLHGAKHIKSGTTLDINGARVTLVRPSSIWHECDLALTKVEKAAATQAAANNAVEREITGLRTENSQLRDLAYERVTDTAGKGVTHGRPYRDIAIAQAKTIKSQSGWQVVGWLIVAFISGLAAFLGWRLKKNADEVNELTVLSNDRARRLHDKEDEAEWLRKQLQERDPQGDFRWTQQARRAPHDHSHQTGFTSPH